MQHPGINRNNGNYNDDRTLIRSLPGRCRTFNHGAHLIALSFLLIPGRNREKYMDRTKCFSPMEQLSVTNYVDAVNSLRNC